MRLASIASVAVLFVAVIILGVVLRPLFPIDETRYVSVAWEMYLSADYFVPTKNGELYGHKPPLLFWLINLAWFVTGVEELSARLVAPAFAVFNIYLTYRLGRHLFPDRTDVAIRAAIILPSLIAYTIYTSLTMFDALLTTASLIGLIGIWQGVRQGTLRAWFLVGVALGVGVLAKGPVILFHIAPALIAFPLWSKNARPEGGLLFRGMGIALAVGLAIILCWLLPAIILGGDAYRHEILWKQSAGRVSNVFDHARPFWFFLMLVPVYLFPWGFNLNFWKGLRGAGREMGDRFLLVAGLSALLLFSLIGSKQAHYLVPEMPILALLVASALGRVTWRRALDWSAPLIAGGALVLAVLLGLGVVDSVEFTTAPGTLALALVALALVAFGGWVVGSAQAATVWSLALIAVVNVGISTTPTLPQYRMDTFIAAFEGRPGHQIAYFGDKYHAEFNFLARFDTPVYLPDDQADILAWAASQSDGLVVARENAVAFDPEPRQVILYRGEVYGIWHTTDLPR